MEGRFRILLLTAALAGVAAPPAQAADNGGDNDQVVQPQVQRRTIKAPDIDAENFEVGVFVGALSIEDFGVHPVYGLRAAYHVTEDFFLEGTYGRSKAGETSYETLSGSAKLLTDQERQLSYYDISVGYNILPGEAFIGDDWAFNTALYVVAGIGNTSFAGMTTSQPSSARATGFWRTTGWPFTPMFATTFSTRIFSAKRRPPTTSSFTPD